MTKNYKKDILSQIVDGGVYGADVASNTVRFAYTNNLTKIASNVSGQIVFYADTTNNTGIIAVGGDIVSSKILNVTKAATTGEGVVNGENTLTVTYVKIVEGVPTTDTITLNVIDKAAAKEIIEDYVTDSSTIGLNSTSQKFEVKLATNGGLDVSTGGGLYVKLGDVVNVDGKTIVAADDETSGKKGVLSTALRLVYHGPNTSGDASTAAHIALVDNTGAELSQVAVSDIIGNGVVDHTSYNKVNNTLSIFFKQADGTTKEEKIDLSELFDITDWALSTGAEDFLSLTINASTAELGVKKATVTYTPSGENTVADLEADTTNGKLVDASEAITAIKGYVDDIADGIAISAQGDSYVNAAVNATNKKKIDVSANVGELTVTTTAGVDSTISGVAGKLADSSNVATKVSEFVNARIDEEVAKLDTDVSTAVALNAENSVYVRGTLTETDGKVTTIGLETQIASTTKIAYEPASGETPAIDPAISVTTNGLATDKDITNLIGYIDDKVRQLQDEEDAIFDHIDSTVGDADASNFVSIEVVQVDASLNRATVDVSYGTYNYVAGTHTFDTVTDGIAQVGATQQFVQNVIESLDLLSTATDAVARDSSAYVTTTISQTNGIVKNESVAVVYADIDASYGSVTVTTDGIATGADIATAIGNCLRWEIL